MPLDQMHGENEPGHPELMLWLARDLITHDYDLRRLYRGIVMSEAYHRDSVWESGDRWSPATGWTERSPGAEWEPSFASGMRICAVPSP